jgi:hypothetical protein
MTFFVSPYEGSIGTETSTGEVRVTAFALTAAAAGQCRVTRALCNEAKHTLR